MPENQFDDNHNLATNEKGQSLVEFVLLLLSIMIVSLMFLKGVNTNLATYWQIMAKILVEDNSQTIELR